MNAETMKFEVPENKLEKALGRIEGLLKARTRGKKVTLRQLAQTVGLLCSFYRAYPGVTSIMLRRSYAEIEGRNTWDQFINMRTEVREEMSWWREHLRSLNEAGHEPLGKPVWRRQWHWAIPIPIAAKKNPTVSTSQKGR